MIKVKNLAQVEITLKFQTRASKPYTKRINPNGQLKLTNEQYEAMMMPDPRVLKNLRFSKYNIVGSLPRKIVLENNTATQIPIHFQRSPKDRWTKYLKPQTEMPLTENEFELVQNLDPRVSVYKQNEHKKRVYVSSILKRNEPEPVVLSTDQDFDLRPEQESVIKKSESDLSSPQQKNAPK